MVRQVYARNTQPSPSVDTIRPYKPRIPQAQHIDLSSQSFLGGYRTRLSSALNWRYQPVGSRLSMQVNTGKSGKDQTCLLAYFDRKIQTLATRASHLHLPELAEPSGTKTCRWRSVPYARQLHAILFRAAVIPEKLSATLFFSGACHRNITFDGWRCFRKGIARIEFLGDNEG
jgi:hypothetical protein